MGHVTIRRDEGNQNIKKKKTHRNEFLINNVISRDKHSQMLYILLKKQKNLNEVVSIHASNQKIPMTLIHLDTSFLCKTFSSFLSFCSFCSFQILEKAQYHKRNIKAILAWIIHVYILNGDIKKYNNTLNQVKISHRKATELFHLPHHRMLLFIVFSIFLLSLSFQ